MKKFLVIDDSESNLLLINKILKHTFTDSIVLTALSGKIGIQLARKELPDTILLDIMMPEMNGFRVCRRLKINSVTKHIPVLLVSALGGNTHDRIAGLKAGADAFISKPFDHVELISQVKVMLRIKEAEDVLRQQNENLEILIKKQTKEYNNVENRFLQITEYALEYFWEIDTEGIFTYVSAVIEKILGYKNDEIIGIKTLFDFPKSHRAETKKALIDIFTDKKNYQEFEILCFHANGKETWLKISGFPIFDKDSNFTGYRGVTQDISLRRKAEDDLKRSLEEITTYQLKLKKINSELILAEEKERRRIAEYLHDGVGQLLSIAHMQLSSLVNKELSPDVKKIISKSSEFLKMAIVQSKTLTYDLKPPILYELGLIPALRWKLDQITNNEDIKAVLKTSETKLVLDDDMRNIMFRIINELLYNVIKHAKADLIEVQISIDEYFYYFSVLDNGQGFNNPNDLKYNKKEGYGLFSIKEQLDSIQGDLIIESEVKKGTKAIVKIPF